MQVLQGEGRATRPLTCVSPVHHPQQHAEQLPEDPELRLRWWTELPAHRPLPEPARRPATGLVLRWDGRVCPQGTFLPRRLRPAEACPCYLGGTVVLEVAHDSGVVVRGPPRRLPTHLLHAETQGLMERPSPCPPLSPCDRDHPLAREVSCGSGPRRAGLGVHHCPGLSPLPCCTPPLPRQSRGLLALSAHSPSALGGGGVLIAAPQEVPALAHNKARIPGGGLGVGQEQKPRLPSPPPLVARVSGVELSGATEQSTGASWTSALGAPCLPMTEGRAAAGRGGPQRGWPCRVRAPYGVP